MPMEHFFLWVIEGVAWISWTVCGENWTFLEYTKGQICVWWRWVACIKRGILIFSASTLALSYWGVYFRRNFLKVRSLFFLLFCSFQADAFPPPVIPGSLRGVTRSWQRWSTCCSTTSPPCRPMQPPTCSTYATVIIKSRQKWVVEH